MPNPKRKHSVQRSRKRRTHWVVKIPAFSPCSQCQKLIVPHRVCPFCGYYKGKPVVQIPVQEEKPK
jgi:large subunit ribosomal protein L32